MEEQVSGALGLKENRVGWREWVRLPELGVPGLKAKVDTGARTSALHASEIETFTAGGGPCVRFSLRPLRKRRSLVLTCEAPLVDERVVRDSGGHAEVRCVIESTVEIAEMRFLTEFTLTNRSDMLFPMLLGRKSLQQLRLIVDVNSSYLHGRRKPRELYPRSKS